MYSSFQVEVPSNGGTSSNEASSSSGNRAATRGENWGGEETLLLIETYSRYFSLLNATDTPNEKSMLLNKLSEEFNSENRRNGRSARVESALIRKWEKLSSEYRKKYRERNQTGQGTPEHDQVYEKMNEILGTLPTTNAPCRFTSHSGVLTVNRLSAPDSTSNSEPMDADNLPVVADSGNPPLAISTSRRPSFTSDSSEHVAVRRRTNDQEPQPQEQQQQQQGQGQQQQQQQEEQPQQQEEQPRQQQEEQQQPRSRARDGAQRRNEASLLRVFDTVLDRQQREREQERQQSAGEFNALFEEHFTRYDRLLESFNEGNAIMRTNSQQIERLITILAQQNNSNNNDDAEQ